MTRQGWFGEEVVRSVFLLLSQTGIVSAVQSFCGKQDFSKNRGQETNYKREGKKELIQPACARLDREDFSSCGWRTSSLKHFAQTGKVLWVITMDSESWPCQSAFQGVLALLLLPPGS